MFFYKLAKRVIDTVLPPRCLATGEIVDRPGMMSARGWAALSFIDAPFCTACGMPLSFAVLEQSLCAACMEHEPVFDAARAAVVYNDASRKLILGFKYTDKLHAAHVFVPWMMRAGADLIAQSDVIIPVPLHVRRLWSRRFNQSALLAAGIAKKSGKSYDPFTLLRARPTRPQKGLSRASRERNVRNAFLVNKKQDVTGKNILLVDDILTSGATLNECARVLKTSGAHKVFVLTIARVTRERD